jgi:hypothetical protein
VETAEDEAATAREVQAMILKADRDWQAERKSLLQRCPPPPRPPPRAQVLHL